MTDRMPGFNTLAIHAGAAPDAATGARATPAWLLPERRYRRAWRRQCAGRVDTMESLMALGSPRWTSVW